MEKKRKKSKDPASDALSLKERVRFATQSASPMGAKKLAARLKAMTRSLARGYQQASGGTAGSPVDEWLSDNYYILEKESKQSVAELRALGRNAAPDLLLIHLVLREVLPASMPPLTEDSLAEILRAVNELRPLGERQFGALTVAVKAVLLEMAYAAYTETKRPEEMAYAVTGFGKLASVDFAEVVRRSSGVEQILLRDPSGVYGNMTADSRRQYRALVSRLAGKKRKTEGEIAAGLLSSAEKESDPVRRHIGYALLRDPALSSSRRRRGMAALLLGWLLPLLGCIALGLWTESVAAAFLAFLPLWEVLRVPLHHLALSGVEADFIPRMELKRLADKPKTVVLVSTLLPKASEAAALADRLEQLSFGSDGLLFCVLADLHEWDYPTDEKDDSQIAAMKKAVEDLNRRFGDRFMLFLRGRSYNRTQRRYSGWERKRGAITEFVRFIRGGKTTAETFVGNREILREIRYLIALDSDTNLLYESAEALLSAAMHPLNQPRWDERGVVTEGFGVLIPKISADLASAKATAFSRVMAGSGGVTAYETRDKDFYQDLFGESVFAGKGLIDVEAFHALLDQRFPENRVLSHDVVEGAYLRCGFLSDVEMTDNTPASFASWLSRLHRWQRGDWQNLPFLLSRYKANGKLWRNPIPPLAKYKLFDNLRRSLTPVAALSCIVAALFMRGEAGVLLWLGALSVMFPSLWAAGWSLSSGGLFTLSRKFFTRTLPHSFQLLTQALFFLIMLPAQSFLSLDAIVRSLWRVFVSERNLLEWTTAAQSEGGRKGMRAVLRRFWLPELFGLLFLLLAPDPGFYPVGIAFALLIPVALFSAEPSAEDSPAMSANHRDALMSYNAAMWRYYDEFANRENHFLPPDNIQQSPVFRVASRTSPTNIGFLLLSVLAARDFGFLDSDGLYRRVERTLATVERLETWNGNLLNWYDTLTLRPLEPAFVSTVDSGNLVACLVALKEGLREYRGEKRELGDLIRRIEAIIEGTQLAALYDEKRKLFSIGYDPGSGKLIDSHYDFLMSEARLTSYFAVARKLVGKKHWGAMARTMSRWGSYAGPVSWTGTMFEYFMPHLLLPVYDGSLLGESLAYCLYCQKRRARVAGVPWGISESAFYAFDESLNYQYKAHGVQKLGVKRHLDKELVISPYSAFLALALAPNSGMRNLGRLRELGVYGRYGFYEAVDFTAGRVAPGGLAVTRSYMAHHIGMSMVASCNALFENRMQKRFMGDRHMKSAVEFLQEKIAKSTVVYDPLKNGEARREKQERPRLREERHGASPLSPRCSVLTNGELTEILTDVGAGYLKFGGVDLTRREADLLGRAQGILTLARMNGKTLSSAPAPFYLPNVEYRMEQQEPSVAFFTRGKELELGVRCLIHPTLSCEQRQIVVKNSSPKKQTVQLLCYLEPVLQSHQDYAAHPAYSKLFVTAAYDRETRTLTFQRRNRDGSSNLFLTVGFLGEESFSFETRREALFTAPEGLGGLLAFHEKAFPNHEGGTPDACCALRFDLTVNAGGQQQATLLLSAARSKAEGIETVIAMRKIGVLSPRMAASSPLRGDSLAARLGSSALGELLFAAPRCPNREDRIANRLGQSALWAFGISGDLPIALVETDTADFDRLEGYVRLHGSLRRLGVEFDLVVLAAKAEDKAATEKLVRDNFGSGLLGTRCGVFALERDALDPEVVTLLRAVSRHLASARQEAGSAYRPALFRPVTPVPLPESHVLAVEGGVFEGGRFYCDRKSPLPWCHVLASPQFGTLVSDTSLGYTWAINSRENKLTPWQNDVAADNSGERLILRRGGSFHNLTQGARASFSREDARYEGAAGVIASLVTVTVSSTGFAKYASVTLRNGGEEDAALEVAYYLEPVLGVNREAAFMLRPRAISGHTLLLHNPYQTALSGHAALSGTGGDSVRLMTDRAAFLSGDWRGGDVIPSGDPAAAVILSLALSPGEERTLRFALGFGVTEESAVFMVTHPLREAEAHENRVRIKTPDEGINQLVNNFLPSQILSSRIRGRTAFYQCGGAYGFRDQLQDVAAYLLLDPGVAKRQILRCSAVQFEEGDVLHWWHRLPRSGAGLKGVRTRFSDDLLWLPLTVAEYVGKTGDEGILTLPVRYLHAPELTAGAQERYISPETSALREDVYAHCVRALHRGYNLGENGLPRIGCGDWNDGFSSVGREGRGTSVWLALFLAKVLDAFAGVAFLRGDVPLREECLSRAGKLRAAVDEHAWDGGWYLRAFFDDGSAMGGHASEECRIDLLPQSFAVFAGMPDRGRVEAALRSALERLVDHRLRLVKLFDPPFQHSSQQPGYVKAYPSGIRENGGQYTHSAVWFALALLEFGLVEEGFGILEMLSPVHRGRRYALEPYSMAADIYTNPSAEGHGGWSLYTGAASWYYRAVLEGLLGLRFSGDALRFSPRLPSAWGEASAELVVRGTLVLVRFLRGEESRLLVDGAEAEFVPLDGGYHEAECYWGGQG